MPSLHHVTQCRGNGPFSVLSFSRKRECWWSWWGRAGKGSQNWRRETLEGLMKGTKDRPLLRDQPNVLPSFRVSHGIAGTLLGEMALCAKKHPPGKKGKEGVAIPGTVMSGGSCSRSQGKRDNWDGPKGGQGFFCLFLNRVSPRSLGWFLCSLQTSSCLSLPSSAGITICVTAPGLGMGD